MKKIRLLLIEENRLLRDGIMAILKPHKDIDAIATSGEGKDHLLNIQKSKPDIVLLELGLRSQKNLQFVDIVKRDFSKAKIIVMDLSPVHADILKYVKAGANGFILKEASLNDFLTTIRAVAEGSNVLPPLLVNSLFTQIVEHAIKEGSTYVKEAARMTKREQEVITLLSQGMSNNEIGSKINISTFTVKSHIHNIMEKLSLHTRLELANYSYTQKTLDTISSSISTINS
jgi:DNA-binding NarL/FixJ family response regulator